MLIHTLNLENTSILIKPDGKTLLQITAIYKKPDAPLLEEDLNQLIKHNHSIIIAGGWNSKHPLWGSRTSNNSGIVLHNFSESESLDIVAPSSPTHYSPLGNPDFLDFAVLKNIPWTPKARTSDDLSSDHLPVIFELNCPKDEFTTQLSRVTNWVHFQQDLISTTPPRLPLKTEVDIDSAVGFLNEKINNSYSKNTIVSSSKLIKNPKTKALIREKNKARKRWQSTWDPAHRATYLNLQGKVNQALEAEKSENWNSFLSKLESSPTDFWKKTKPIRKKTDKITSLNANGKTLLTDKEIGNDLSEHFSKHFSKAEDEVPSYLTDNSCHHPQENILSMTTPNEVKEVIKNLGNHKAPGHDNITPQMTKNLPIKWIVFLAGIFNAALHLCYFPKTWKHAIIITIPKKSPVKSPEDLRPISLLSTIGKVYERIVLRRLQTYMDSINFIIPQQFGFRKGHSSTHQLITVIDYIQIRKSHKEAVGAVFLDLTKAFDRVWHDGLIAKITKKQFPRDFIKFLKNYLQDRTFSIKQGNYITTAKPTQIGVPQGSILGPYLFNIYINDFPQHPKCQIKLFADDAAILANSKSIGIITTQLQNYINSITKWCNDWKLDINPKKSQAIIFPPLDNKKFKPQSILKHIISTSNRAIRKLNILRRLCGTNWGAKPRILRTTYTTLIRPIMEYATPVWAPSSSSLKTYSLESRRQNKNNLDRHFGNEEPEDEISLTTCGLVDPPFSENEVKLTAFKFGKMKSSGPEGIDNTVVKALVRMHPSLLSRLFNKCLDTGTFPEAWKVARVVLLEKSGRKGNSPNDYRPLSLLVCLGKVLDSLLAQRLKHWLESNELLSSFQHGFREGKSTTTALNEVLEGVEMGLNKGAWVLFVALDIDGAFNSMSWNKLMRNLMDMGCPDNLCSLIRDFLRDRRISLSFGGRKLERNCARGCPQGSCCGPILWNILVNTVFQEELHEGDRLVLYADDQFLIIETASRAKAEKGPTGIGTEVFTDGSKSGTNTGAGVVIYTNGELIFQEGLALRVDELVFSAELVAIRVALRVCAEKNFSPDRLYSDCMSALVVINLEKGQLAHQIIQELEIMTRAPELPWFRRHSLIEGNEFADRIAKAGCFTGRSLRTPVTKKEVYRRIRGYVQDLWLDRWRNSVKGREVFNGVTTPKYLCKVMSHKLIRVVRDMGSLPQVSTDLKLRETLIASMEKGM
ncbi:hypothetical protein LAZ67_X004585 [Cordylochernes scorpioides]|uniref:Reverse transcriptase n=1 Tax=Cordylochernes scorpioides TaxID=51811 RepID=A0ABY6LV27_9ARAC|nr:hypothetical protein LAZ67_X004585 [Cordylochernes scorpioides]